MHQTGIPEASSSANGSSVASSLLLRAKLGCDDSWRQLVELFAPLVYRWCWKSGVRGPEADDVVQEVFVNVVRCLENFRRERPGDTFRGWLWTITRHELLDHWRQSKNRPRNLDNLAMMDRPCLVSAAEVSSREDSITGPRDVGLLYGRAVDSIRGEFESPTWQAFWQVVVEERAAADVAADLGLTANAVYIAKSRVLRRLRDTLVEDG